MKKVIKIVLMALAIVAVGGIIGVFTLGPRLVEESVNSFVTAQAPSVATEVESLHERLFIADLHADSLLWGRNLLERADYGHVDVPRLIEANVALQVFSVFTKVPRARSYDRTEADSDLVTWFTLIQRWPLASWSSLTERALYQARQLADAAERSGGRLTLIRSVADLKRHLQRRDRDSNVTAGILAIEGLHAIEANLENLDALYRAGYRMMGLTHHFDNAVAGSAHGVEKGGLTELGERAVARMEALSIIVDLAHASPQAIEETLDIATRPVVVSHTGVAATCPGPRNLTDQQVQRIAETGGVIGIGYFEAAICGLEPDDFAKAVRHIVDLVGIDHVGLGSDFDGAVHTKFDVTGLPFITKSLLEAGFTDQEIEQIMGGNVLRLLDELLPRDG
jgi:microsomal dipeptidase-like Zn-dependent dipeptidase